MSAPPRGLEPQPLEIGAPRSVLERWQSVPPRGLEPQPLEVEAPRSILERWHVKRCVSRFDLAAPMRGLDDWNRTSGLLHPEQALSS